MGHNSRGVGRFIFVICQCLTNNFKNRKKANFVNGYFMSECSNTDIDIDIVMLFVFPMMSKIMWL